MTFARVPYAALNPRQKENHNFHLVAARLAEYGFTSLRLTDDFEGADFVALHVDGQTILKVQLKGRLTFDRKYVGKGLHVAFRQEDRIFVYPHDQLFEELRPRMPANKATEAGSYSRSPVPRWAMTALEPHEI